MIRCELRDDKDNPSFKKCARKDCGREIISDKWSADQINLKCLGVQQPSEAVLTPKQEKLAKEYKTPKNIVERGFNLLGAVGDFISDGLETCTKEEYESRLKICEPCPKRENNTCTICTCNLKLKAAMKSQHCPIKKWVGDK